ncbi:benzaldehyde dehydrogenase [Arthrobacter sp. AL08]|nr:MULTISPECIES: benzaldehyde dehydrogenase [Micrococcaceae]MDI3240887.1 benzaldehyde dehydrogenase [Arthrobacter sp. AL05]MDI3277137.1 benzaldehyde dehydrogenase [Arthrobacter sp. AL08]MDJ0352386.1 benzaldehyde dehydrogenase [Pseudarthrobacter sp. PH31-O2]
MKLMDPTIWDGKIFTGSWTLSDSGDTAVVEPATGKELGRIGTASADDVDAACKAAAAAQPAWAETSFEERAAVLRRAGMLFEQHADEIHEWIIREAGSILPKAQLETHTAAQECFEASALPSRGQGELLAAADPERLSFSRRVPVGVVGVIAPFNVPLILAIRAVAPALALGNAVVLKPDMRTAVAGGVSIARVFEEAGLPAGVLQMLPGGAEAGASLVANRETRVIAFTGSTAAGRRVGASAAEHLKRAHLELGGNNAMIVLADADVELAASNGAWGSFLHQGQICMTAGRHIVHESIADEYVALLAEKARQLTVGDPFTEQVALGPIIDVKQRDNIHRLVTDSVAGGATLLAGGTFDGLFYAPTVLDGVRPDTPAFCSEVFGPVAPVIRFSTVEEAVELAKDSEYGLSVSIITSDAMSAWSIARHIPSGLVHINDQTVGDEAHIPFGGVRNSGTGGRIGGAEANLESFTENQWVTMQAKPARYPF